MIRGIGDGRPTETVFGGAAGPRPELTAELGVGQQFGHRRGEGGPIAVNAGIVPVFEVQAGAPDRRGHDGLPAGHGFQHLDVGAGGNFERRHHHGCPGVERPQVLDEAVERDPAVERGWRAARREALPEHLVLRAGHHAQARFGKAGPHARHHLVRSSIPSLRK